MKIFYALLSFCLICLTSLVYAQADLKTTNGEISFYSKTPVEDITAISKKAAAVLDLNNNAFHFSVKINSFKFPNGLMEEHFNENYMESEKYVYGSFKGKFQEKIDWKKDGTYNLTAVGNLIVHGVSQPRTITGTVEVVNGVVTVKSDFKIKLEDHKITRPSIVMMKIAEVIDVKAKFTFSPA